MSSKALSFLTQDKDSLFSYMDKMRSLSCLSKYKDRFLEQLSPAPGDRVLDVGCGTGDDVKRIAELVGPSGWVTGVDVSEIMIEESLRRWSGHGLPMEFRIGDLTDLELEPDSFDAAQADRVLQHVEDPSQALSELLRVVRPEGQVLAADSDFCTFIIDIPDTPNTRTFFNFSQKVSRHPWIGRQLYGLFRRAGFVDVQVSVEPLVFLDYEELQSLGHIESIFLMALEEKVLQPDDVNTIRGYFLEAQEQRSFFAQANIFIVRGFKPRA